ncbi:MAG: hypothetical protein ABL919_08060 [Methylococcales bacterium]|nr:hypothetical protein [Methylococcaceae bacterium]
MFKQSILIIALIAGVISCAQAQNQPTEEPNQTTENPHKSKDSVFRSCKQQADQKQLSGNDRSAFVANCVKTTPR